MSDPPSAPGMAAVTDHHRRLEPFAGTFSARTKWWREPGAPPAESTGTMTNTWRLGGRFLEQHYLSQMMGAPFEGMGLWGYNTITQRYEGVWMDNMGTGISFETGSCDKSGRVFTMLGEIDNPSTGQKVPKRSVISLKNSNEHVFEIYFTFPGAPEFKVMEVTYTRK
jgi:hypothetical protein